MTRLETEPERVPRGVLLGLGLVLVIVAGSLAGVFILRLQPSLTSAQTSGGAGVVIMPSGIGTNPSLNYAPVNITVIIGLNNTVTFKDEDNSAPYHTVTATDGSFDSGNMAYGQSWTHAFTTPGTYTYYCKYHFWMRGTVIVLPAGSASSSSST